MALRRGMWPLLLAALLLLGCATTRPAAAAKPISRLPVCSGIGVTSSVVPKWHDRVLGGELYAFSYDGVSPFIPEAIRVTGNNMKFPLVGRGSENPLRQDPFGAGMRISTRYAYLGGKVCAWVTIPEPASGTIFGMYLIDVHPKGSERGGTKWREADLEWLGLKPASVQTSVFEMGQEQPQAQEHDLPGALGGATQRDPIRYCIEWDLLSPAGADPAKKFVRFTAKSLQHPAWVTLREWHPSSPEAAAFWSEPLRAIFTFWSNNHIVGWSGAYGLKAGEMLWVDVKDVRFVPRGPAFCPKPDNDLEPMS